MTEEMNMDNLGFFKKGGGDGTYFHVFDNSICQKSKTELPGWEGPISTTNPKTKKEVETWVMRYDSVAVFIVDCERFKKEFTAEQGGGKVSGLNLSLQAGSMKATLTLKWIEPVLKRFLQVAPNINFENPILISVFKSPSSGKIAVSFKQPTGPKETWNPKPKEWDKVPQYWHREIDPVTNQAVDPNAPSLGADGSVLPQPVHDEFTDEWDYNAQNVFLLKYFVANVEPKIKEIALKFGPPKGEDNFPTHTGTDAPAQIPVVTTKPENPVAQSTADMATGGQRAQIKQLSTQANFDFVSKCQEVMGCSFDELNQAAASFAIYKLTEMITKQGQPVAQVAAAPQVAVAPAAPVAPVAPAPAISSETGDWGAASAPTVKSAFHDDDMPDV